MSAEPTSGLFWSLVAERLDRQLLAAAALDSPTSWVPCSACTALGGWDANITNEDGHHVWPIPDHTHGRPNQHFQWARGATEAFFQSGRGSGKTRSASEDRLALASRYPGTVWYVVGATATDTRDFCFEGDSGLVTVAERRGLITDRDKCYNRSTGAIELRLDNGSVFYGKSGEKPDRLRGPNAHGAWVDEPGSQPKAKEIDAQLDLLVRAKFPDGFPTTKLFTGTPSRTPFMRTMVERAQRGEILWRRGHTYDNAANLDRDFLDRLKKYEGTEWGRQELEGLLLSAVEGALWNDETIERMRVEGLPEPPRRALVCVDPSASKSETNDECGIITVLDGGDGYGYAVRDDTRRGLPHEWAETVIDACLRWVDYSKIQQPPLIVLETNYAKEWMLLSLRESMRKRSVNFQIVEVHATEGKETRAEPIAAICHGHDPKLRILGVLPRLEDELVSWKRGDPSPNRLDAFVWGGRHLFAHLIGTRSAERPKTPPRALAGIRTRAM